MPDIEKLIDEHLTHTLVVVAFLATMHGNLATIGTVEAGVKILILGDGDEHGVIVAGIFNKSIEDNKKIPFGILWGWLEVGTRFGPHEGFGVHFLFVEFLDGHGRGLVGLGLGHGGFLKRGDG